MQKAFTRLSSIKHPSLLAVVSVTAYTTETPSQSSARRRITQRLPSYVLLASVLRYTGELVLLGSCPAPIACLASRGPWPEQLRSEYNNSFYS
jgi:hypothetical protein